jgi:hypothetical protein
MRARVWDVQLFISEEDNVTKARAVLVTDDPVTTLQGEGTARLHPHELCVPEIGSEIAVSRALSELATVLLDTALDDIRGMAQQA